MKYPSWGLIPEVKSEITLMAESKDMSGFFARALDQSQSLLGRGLGRSYGDSCLNDGGALLVGTGLNKFISFDAERGLLTCEAGVSFDEILKTFVPKGWFLPVTPGTKFVTVAGAIANDVHGKNHHAAGNFGHFVESILLARSDGAEINCSRNENTELFFATIGGLGLTGLILKASFYLRPIQSAFIDEEQIRFKSLKEFFELSKQSEENYEYTVAWVDCINGKDLKGIFIRGNHSEYGDLIPHKPSKIKVPIFLPNWVLNSLSIRIFNWLYYLKNFKKVKTRHVHYEPFFYPLDAIQNWNRIYGKRGFYQYQFVLPDEPTTHGALEEIFSLIKKSGQGSFLAVLKTFGEIPSQGLMSFPHSGVTLALDFANTPKTHHLFDELEKKVLKAGGRVYPAKDAHMSQEAFRQFYRNTEDFKKYVDARFASSFSRRVGIHT